MDFMTAVKTCFTKFADFNGRASRSEFWWFMLFCVGVNIVVNIVFSMIPIIGFIVFWLVSLALLVPCLSVGARRLHDINKSGWLVLITLIPLVGLVMIYFFVQPSDGSNQYGPVPQLAA